MKLYNKVLLLIVVLSFLFSLGYSFFYKINPVVDAQAYDQIALNLVVGNGFRENPNKSFQDDYAIVRAGPGYEFFLAIIYKLFGHKYSVVWIFQAFFHALSALFLFLIAKEIFKEKGDKIGLFSAGIFGLHPDLIEISAMLMTETLYLFFIILTVWFFTKSFNNLNKLYLSAFLGFSLGLGILFRPPLILFIPIFLFFYFVNKNYKSIILFSLGLVMILTPWTIRNYYHFGQVIPTTMIGSYNIWIGNTINSSGGQIAGGFNPIDEYVSKNNFVGLPKKASSHFKNFIIENPVKFLNLTAVRFVRYFSLIRPMGFWFYQTGLSQMIFVGFSAFFIAFLFIFGIAGLLLLFFEKHKWRYYILFLAITSPIVLLPTVVQSRYRFQVYPFFALTLGYFIIYFFEKKKKVKEILFYTISFLLFITFLDLSMFGSVVLERLSKFF